MARLSIDTRDSGAVAFTVTLSRRNLLALLHKLDMPDSARTITNGYVYRNGYLVPAGAAALILQAEEDHDHYLAREEPGTMFPDTEEFIKEALSKEGPKEIELRFTPDEG